MVRCIVASVFFLSVIVGAAVAADFTTVINDLDGNPVVENQTQVTLGGLAVAALLSPYPDEPNLKDEEKIKRYVLAMKLYKAPDVTLLSADLALVKSLIAKRFSPLYVGRAYELLEPASVPK